MTYFSAPEVTLDKPEAQAFVRDLIELCNRHRMRLTGTAAIRW